MVRETRAKEIDLVSLFKKEEEFLASLSPEQAAAANEFSHPLLLVAGAGSGKTRTLIGRATKLLLPKAHKGIGAHPGTLMLVTFTNKAAGEMRERFTPILKGLSSAGIYGDPWVGTFHSISMRILREEASHAGLGENFGIIDDSDAKEVAKEAFKAADLEAMDIDEFFTGLEYVKARLYMPRLLIARRGEADKLAGKEPSALTPVQREWRRILEKVLPAGFEKAYDQYQKILTQNNVVDFSDLINTVTFMMRSKPAIRDTWRSRFRHFMVDESQDMNPAQAAWLAELTGKGAETDFDPTGLEENVFGEVIVSEHGHAVNLENLRDFPRPTIMFVGDPRQAIYGFRGSDPRMMEGLPESYEGLKVLELVESYRCSANVLTSANRLIGKNGERFGSGMVPADPERIGVPVEIRAFKDWNEEFAHMTDNIKDSIKSGTKPGEIGVLVRTKAAAKEIAAHLRNEGVPVTEGKASNLRMATEYKDLMAYANFLINPDAEIFLRRIINKPARGMGMKSLGAVQVNAKMKNIGFTDELRTIMNDKIDLPEGQPEYSTAFRRHCKEFGLLIVKMRNEIMAMDAAGALDMILRRSNYLPTLMREAMVPLAIADDEQDRMVDLPIRAFIERIIEIRKMQKTVDVADASGRTRKQVENLSEMGVEDIADRTGGLSESMRRIGNLMLILDQAEGAPSLAGFVQEATLEMSKESDAPGVNVMTLHASKGKEYKQVYMPCWYEGMMPHYNSLQGEALREERRLAYVGMTRAMEKLLITTPENIFGAKFSFGGEPRTKPSPFLNEIASASPDVVRFDSFGNRMAAGSQPASARTTTAPRAEYSPVGEMPKRANAWVFSKKRATQPVNETESPQP